MKTNQKISDELNEHGFSITARSVGRYISGDRLPIFDVAEKLAEITGSETILWLNRKQSEQRKKAVRLYSNKTGTVFHDGPGRPKRT